MSKFNHLTLEDREILQKRLDQTVKQCVIAAELNVHPSTISNEIKRNSKNTYFCLSADKFSKARRKQSNMARQKVYSVNLKWYVLRKLVQRWTPEDISNRLKLKYPYDSSKWISHETIYKWIFEYKLKGVSINKYLLRKNKQTDKRGRKGRRKSINRRLKPTIHDRPKSINLRETIGHWEGDTVVGAGRTGFIGSFIERKSRYYITVKMENLKADTFNKAIRDHFALYDNEKVQSFTFDQGTEMSFYENLQEFMNCKVYFADPGSPWQKGQVENIHTLLRVFYPKKTSFKNITQEELDKVTHIINNKPRKCLGYRTPYEVFHGKSIIY